MTNSSSPAPSDAKSEASGRSKSPIDEYIVELNGDDELFDSGTQPRSLAALAERDRRREQLYLSQQARQQERQAQQREEDDRRQRAVNKGDAAAACGDRKPAHRKRTDGERSQGEPTASDISPVMIVDEKVTSGSNVAEHRARANESNAVNRASGRKVPATAEVDRKSNSKKSASDSNNRSEMEKSRSANAPVLSAADRSEKKHKSGFLSRFAGFRFSLRGNKKKLKSLDGAGGGNESTVPSNNIVYVSKSATIDGSGQVPFTRSRPAENGRGPGYQRSSMRSNEFVYIPLKDPKSAFNDEPPPAPATPSTHSSGKQTAAPRKSTSPPSEEKAQHVLTGKPPLPRQPPRVVGVCAKPSPATATKSSTAEQRHAHQQRSSSAPREIHPSDMKNFHSTKRNNGFDIDDEVDFYQSQLRSGTRLNQTIGGGMTSAVSTDGMLDDSAFIDEDGDDGKIGLIETNLDTDETIISGKTRSLMELGPQQLSCHRISGGVARRLGNRAAGMASGGAGGVEPRRPHKSMEFLLDKENQRFVLVSECTPCFPSSRIHF